MTKAELILWSKLRRKQVQGTRFRRQYSVVPYVVDFYCPSLKLAIEVDGDSHNKTTEYHDKDRQGFVESYGIEFLRFTNTDIYENVDGVVDEIFDTVASLKKS